MALGEVPVGAVLVGADGSLLAAAHNEVESTHDATAHAELLCLRRGGRRGGSWRLGGATLFVTVEPCAMCAGGVLLARVAAVVYGARSPLLGADGSWAALLDQAGGGGGTEGPVPPRHPLHPDLRVRRGVLEPECRALMVDFFRKRRRGELPHPHGWVPPGDGAC